jgi:ComF family protein
MFRHAAQRLADAVFGGSCFLCRGPCAGGALCEGCASDLPKTPAEHCPRCALPSTASQVCGRCIASPPRFDATRAALVFRFPADVIVHALKYRGELALARFCAQLLCATQAREDRIDALVPVPLSAERTRSRGYNQAMEIARQLARMLDVRLAPELCERIRDTPEQMRLPFVERARNVRGAFRCTAISAPATVAVLDDVMTTGATLDEIAGALKQAGATRVVNWVLARTPPPADL